MLSSAITIDTEQYRKVTFNLTANFSGDTDISRCLFVDCVNLYGNGGAISVVSDSETGIIAINNSGFLNCWSTFSAGAFYIAISAFSIERTCFCNCSSELPNSTLLWSSTDDAISLSDIEIQQEIPVNKAALGFTIRSLKLTASSKLGEIIRHMAFCFNTDRLSAAVYQFCKCALHV
jgi:hypothetical protein